ncbi:hypothetical protein SAMN05444396_104294 [Flavobacterium segetis]|uniref:CarboxypepD_reg-like domain-containing protein n=1 Tax=Flavobacterium segetis TaxID=271157 RepID=A0A1M5H122_9FLAO|nr:hypothetical protein [Flavobacterium segetis]SHG09664.1 hypothetical protein SAMN05444396_104294 [Flavobacterium segetis]
MRRKSLIIFLFLIFQNISGQTIVNKPLRVKITIDSSSAYGINVVNLNNKETTVTNSNGEFSILAKANDVLMFSALNLETYKRIVGRDDIQIGVLAITMHPGVIKLEEVVVNSKSLNVLSLGIVTKAPVTYTTAERRLQTAGDFKPVMLLNLLGGSMPLDPLINKINGRTKRLKKIVTVEKKESNIKFISKLYDDEYFIRNLKIPSENIASFKYYIVENENFKKVLDTKNMTQISFYMGALAEEFKTLLTNNN